MRRVKMTSASLTNPSCPGLAEVSRSFRRTYLQRKLFGFKGPHPASSLYQAFRVQAVPSQSELAPSQGASVRISHATNFHLVLHAVYKNPPEAKVEQLQLLEELTLQRLDDLNVDSLITVMFAFARSQYSPHPLIQQRMAAATEADMASFTPRQLEHTATSLAAVGFRPSEGWLNNFAYALQVNWEAFRPSQLAVTLVQAAACGLNRLPDRTLADQMPALLRRLTSSGMEPGTLAKLVWSAAHFEPFTTRTHSRAVAGAPAATPARVPGAGGQAADGSRAPDAAGSEDGWASSAPASVLPERELLGWWEGEGTVEAAEPGDLVLLLNGLARLGVRPGRRLTRRLLAAVMGSHSVLAQLPPAQLALLAWSTLKLTEEPPRREWLDGLLSALRCRVREPNPGSGGGAEATGPGTARGLAAHSEGSGVGGICVSSGPVERDGGPRTDVSGGCSARPSDVALVLSSLVGLGAHMSAGARGEFGAYWRNGSHWAELSTEDREVMSLLGFGPVAA